MNTSVEVSHPSITAVIIARDEAEMIANCIETLRWCDEILLVDNQSSDATPELAENLGARVVKIKTDSFAELRSKALRYVKTDWVFYVDADERVTPQLSQEILVHIETHSGSALQINRQNINYGHELKHGGWDKDVVTRVFLKTNLEGWFGQVHESPKYQGETILLHSGLLHFTHRNTIENLKKSLSWTPIEAKLLFDAKTPPVTIWTLLRKGLMEVFRRGILKSGYKDGSVGWIEAVVQGLNRVLVYVQVWELQQNPSLKERYQDQEQAVARQWRDHLKNTAHS